MDTHTTARKPTKARPVRPQCCASEKCTSGSRNNYYPGKRMTPHAHHVEQAYLIERRRLLNRAIHGWGVVYGFPVAMLAPDEYCKGAELGILEVGQGLALDRAGRELLQTDTVALTLENVILLDDKGSLVRAHGCSEKERMAHLKPDTEACWQLRVHYAEQNIEPVTVKDPCSCKRTEWDQVCETVRYSLQRIECDKCCADPGCELKCYCGAGPCCSETSPDQSKLQEKYEELYQAYEKRLAEYRADGTEEEMQKLRLAFEERVQALKQQGWAPPKESTTGRGGCRCLCDHLTGLSVDFECGAALCQIDECARTDLRNGVALACVKLDQDECGNWRFASVYDACGVRRLVKRNDLLFDLIRGCDVTRISEIGWKDWHRRQDPIPFQSFSDAMGSYGGEPQAEYVTNDFWVKFSRPVREKSVLPDCFAMTVLAAESEGGWWQAFRVPVVRVETLPPESGDPAGHTRGAKIVVDGGWLEDAVRGRNSIFFSGQARVEIEVRGDFIVDCNGQTVDANPRGLSPFPTGSDGPGDSFLSTFTIEQRPGFPKQKAYEQPPKGVRS